MTLHSPHIRYREDKTTQAAAKLLQREGGRMNYMKLIKLLYLADRAALVRWGRPITMDWYVSMPHGPVLSFTYDKICEAPSSGEPSYWHRFVSPPADYKVELLGEVPDDQLSRAEEDLLTEIWETHGHLDEWKLVDLTHKLPEWRDPKGSSSRISMREILRAQDFSDEEIADIFDSLAAENAVADARAQ